MIFEAPDALFAVRLFDNWTALDVGHVTPIMKVEDLLGLVDEPG